MSRATKSLVAQPGALSTQPRLRVVGESTIEEAHKVSRRPMVVGFIVLLLFFGMVVAWAGSARLSSAALAPGVVNVEGARKTIQHLEGGIVHAINVREGQHVEAGDVLIELDNTSARADVEILTSRWILAQARQARLRAERDEADSVGFPRAFINVEDKDGAIAEAMREQERLFISRKRRHEEKIRRQNERINQLERQIGALEAEYATRNRQLALLRGELVKLSGLRQRGLLARDKVYELEQREAEIQGAKSADLAAIAGAREHIGEVALKISEVEDERSDEADRDLQALQDELVELNQRLRKEADILNRTQIRAPSSGTVINLNVHTTGGVIKSGEPILDIVPTSAQLIIDTHVETKDRDVVRAGLPAEIRFSAFSRRSTLPVKGEVVFISADSIADERTGVPYYLARVAFRENPSEVLAGAVIHPGMQVDVLIVTGKRTALEYLFQPITRSVNRALKED